MSKSLLIDAQKKYIEKNKDRIEFQYTLESTQFMGFKNVAKGLFGKVYFIPAIRDAGDDVNTKDSSVFGKLYSELISEMTMNNQYMKKIRDDLNQLFRILNRLKADGVKNTTRPRELISIEKEINSFLAPWGTNLEVEFKNLDIESICKSHTRIWIHDGVRTDIGRKGHGLQRALVIALVRLIAKKQQSTQAIHSSDINGKTASKSAFFLIEEPELYLHPQAQRELFDSLTSLTDSGHQVIACTHSSAMIDLKHYKSIYIATKEHMNDGTKVRYCHDDICTGKTEKNFFKLAYWMNPDRGGELCFAKKVILIEGATEKTVFPFLAKMLGIFSHDISLVECGSKTAMPPYIRLLNHFSIPYVVVYDKDHHTNKGPKAKTSADIASNTIESSINYSIGDNVVLENDIEEELGLLNRGGSKPFNALQHIKNDQFILSGSFKEKIFSIYDLNSPGQCRSYAYIYR